LAEAAVVDFVTHQQVKLRVSYLPVVSKGQTKRLAKSDFWHLTGFEMALLCTALL
jgi:hypothetical protein